MKLLVVYESQTGYTRKYAQWIAEETGSLAVSLKDCTPSMLEAADLLIFGGSIHGGIISGESRFSKLAAKAGKANPIYFGVGIRPATPRTLDLVKKNNFGSSSAVSLFYFRGGYDKEKLSQGDRTMMMIYRTMLKRRRDLHPEDEEMLETLRYPCDYSGKDQIIPLLEELQKRM